jgi:selenocysteine lyase/cysteine desulfurase
VSEKLPLTATRLFSEKERLAFQGDTPALGGTAYFSHGSVSLPPSTVFDAQRRYLDLEQSKGTQAAIQTLTGELEQVRASVAAVIGAKPHQIAFADSASRAWALAFQTALDAGFGETCVTTDHEWSSNALNLIRAHEQGRIKRLARIAHCEAAIVDSLNALEHDTPMDARVIVSSPFLPTAYGVPCNLAGVADWAHERDGLLLVDASHAVGHLPVDVNTIGCDAMVFPARKWLRGPKGIAVLYLSDRAVGRLGTPSSLDIAGVQWSAEATYQLADDARRFETYDHSPGLRLGLQAACDYAMNIGIARIEAHNLAMRLRIEQDIEARCGLRSLETTVASAMMTYAIPSEKIEAAQSALAKAGVSASLIGDQHARWYLARTNHTALLRLTPHYFTTDIEIARLFDAIWCALG